MSYNKIIRRVLALSITFSVLILAFLSASIPIYLEVLKTLTIPLGIVLGGYFSVEGVKNYKKEQNNELG